MNNQCIIVLDIGTTTAKVIVFSTDGAEIAIESIPYTFLERPEGYYEQDPVEVMGAIEEAAFMAVKKAAEKAAGFKPLAISIVCQGGSLVPCDSEGNHVHPMITWMDTRATEVTDRLIQSGEGQVVYDKTGFLPSPGLPLSMIIWLRENEKEVFSKTEKWLALNDYVVRKLTGNFVTNHSSAGLTQLMNVDTKAWDEDLLRLAGVSKDQLSDIRDADASAGELLEGPAKRMGLESGIPVVNGVHDRTAEAIGLGHFEDGESWIGTGTAWVVCSIIDAKKRKCALTSNFHTMTDKRIASTLIGGLGSSVEWWIQELIKNNGGTRKETLEGLDSLVSQSPVGANGLMFRAFTGTGNEGSFINETAAHTDGDRTRAIYEAIAFEFKKAYMEFSEHADIRGSLTLVGGAARSKTWPKIIAEVLGVTIEVSEYDHDPALGAAILGAKYLTPETDYKALYEVFKTEKSGLLPDAKNIEIYEGLFKTFCEQE